MKKYLAFSIFLLLFTSMVFSDFYIKEKYQAGALNNKGKADIDEGTVSEYWIGNDKIAAQTENRTVILDNNANRIYFIFPGTKTYIESQFPMEPSKLRSTEVGNLLSRIQFQMSVSPTSEKKTIKNRSCTKYIISNWVVDGSNRKGEVKRTVWITSDVPFNLDLYWDIVTHLLKLVSDDQDFFKELEKSKGFPMKSESLRDLNGVPITTTQEIIEVSEKKAPTGIYSVPKGYKKQETLSVPDLLTLLKD